MKLVSYLTTIRGEETHNQILLIKMRFESWFLIEMSKQNQSIIIISVIEIEPDDVGDDLFEIEYNKLGGKIG